METYPLDSISFFIKTIETELFDHAIMLVFDAYFSKMEIKESLTSFSSNSNHQIIPDLQSIEKNGFISSISSYPGLKFDSRIFKKKYIGILSIYQIQKHMGPGKSHTAVRVNFYIQNKDSGKLVRIKFAELNTQYAIENLNRLSIKPMQSWSLLNFSNFICWCFTNV